MTLTLLREVKESFPLFEIDFGETTIYVTTSKSPIHWNGHEYWPEPALNAKLPKQSGGLSEEPLVVTVPTQRPLHPPLQAIAMQLSLPRSAPHMEIRIINLLKAGEDEFTPVFVYEGILDRVKRNPEGKKNVVELEFQTELRYQLSDISLGMRADPECGHIYGRNGCFVDNSQFFSAGDYFPNQFKKIRRAWVTASFFLPNNGRQVTLSPDAAMHPGMPLQTLTAQPRTWWIRSYLEKNTVRIPIQEWFWNDTIGQGTNIFVLNRIPPADWHNSRLLLVHGCPQTSDACAERNNTINFGAYGFGIPAYNPTLDVADS